MRKILVCLLSATALAGTVGCTVIDPARRATMPVQAEFINASQPTLCAEEDNVYVKVVGTGISAFRIVAEHPPYIASVVKDSTDPDFTNCDMSNDPVYKFEPRTVILYEDARTRLVGHAFPTFWRPESVDFRVGDRVERGLHLVQLVRLAVPGPEPKPRDVEILVLYPSDGYWRPKPLPPSTLPDSAYGSSFLFGPVEHDGRPYVALREVTFDPVRENFDLVFRDGSRGRLGVSEVSRKQLVLSLSLDRPLAPDRPFAALRSMFVTTDQADVSLVAWNAGAAGTQSTAPVLSFGGIRAPAARFGRSEPSHHNLSAPDIVFDGFTAFAPR
ncbi:MAG: hypothetical protein ING90_13170 [Rhodocyclaceae bacterium]|jgi:hypothetical protein|nr:hypothetical protein [Rhodocyclaceae bacterium]MCE2979178.1 hypothetical protein [Betaproteobacteria bacterium]MCA3076093.1 hypothetical protein [Rhodocyclaceae bacterium]MCA3090003.1 hypothetical protein [Rhodocyclaceae bacterium]MCA3093651.1 hypothetical protein [Rhodocyclaceae bacterium]